MKLNGLNMNKINTNPSVSNNVSFKGSVANEFLKSNKFDEFVMNAASSKPIKNAVEWAGKNDNLKNQLKKHCPVGVALVLSSFYALRTMKSDKIENDRKKTLAINMGVVAGISTVGGYMTDKWINNNFIDNIKMKFRVLNKSNKEVRSIVKGVSSALPLIVFATMYRYIGPVIATPLADKVSKSISDRKAA